MASKTQPPLPPLTPLAPYAPTSWKVAIRNSGLARRVAMQHVDHGLDLDDLMQEALIGVCRAAESYDPSRGNWPRYAIGWARAAIQEAIYHAQLVRRPVRELRQVRGAGSTPAIGDLADALPDREPRIDPDDWEEVLAAIDALPGVRRTAVRLRYGLGGDGTQPAAPSARPPAPLTLTEVGAAIGMGRQGAADHIAAAIASLRESLAGSA